MIVGDRARATRRFETTDIEAYVALGGEQPKPGAVPEALVGALFSYLLGVELPGRGANYLKQQTRFETSAKVGEMLTAEVEITCLRPETSLVDLSTTCRGEDGRLLAGGRALIFVGDRPAQFS